MKSNGFMVWSSTKPKQVSGLLGALSETMIELSKDREMSLHPMRVLVYLLGRIELKKFTFIRQTEIGAELGIDPSNVCKVMNLLCRKGVIETDPAVGRGKCYRFAVPPSIE